MPARKGKIAVLSMHSCPLGKVGGKDTGGMSIYLRELTKELGKQGFTLDIYTRLHSDGNKQVKNLSPHVRLIHLKAGPVQQLDKLQLYQHRDEFNLNLEEFRRRHDLHYHLIFSHYWLSGWAGCQLQKWWQIPQLMMYHTLAAAKNAASAGEAEPKLRMETEKIIAGKCNRIIAATENEKEQLVFYYNALPESINVIPCGVNLDLFRPLHKEQARQKLGFAKEKIILFVGRLEPVKGLDRLLKAIGYLEGNQELRVVIIGGDEHSQAEVERLRRLAKSLQFKGTIDFLGLIDHNEMPLYYSAADVCAVVSYYESFGLVALEAMACGTPVVATNVGILRNIIRQGETGYIVEANCTSSDLAGRIALLLGGSTGQTAASIREVVLPYSWANVARQVKSVIEETAN